MYGGYFKAMQMRMNSGPNKHRVLEQVELQCHSRTLVPLQGTKNCGKGRKGGRAKGRRRRAITRKHCTTKTRKQMSLRPGRPHCHKRKNPRVWKWFGEHDNLRRSVRREQLGPTCRRKMRNRHEWWDSRVYLHSKQRRQPVQTSGNKGGSGVIFHS